MSKTAEQMAPIEQKKMCCAEDGEESSTHMTDELQRNLMNRMNRIEGQVKGVKRMIDRNVYCDDILTQNVGGTVCIAFCFKAASGKPYKHMCNG